MKDFKQLNVWQKAHPWVLDVYSATVGFPDDERFGLTSQLRRSSASVPTNLAEGCGRSGDREFARYCDIAMGSASESEYQLPLARDLGYLPIDAFQSLNDRLLEVKRMLNALIRTLRQS